MKREDVFEVREPPPHGLTRLRAGMEERRASRILRPVLVMAVVAVLISVVLWPRAEVVERVDFSASVAQMNAMPGGGAVVALGDTGVELVPTSDARVVFARIAPMRNAGDAPEF